MLVDVATSLRVRQQSCHLSFVGDTVRQSTFASVRRVDPPDGAAGPAQWELTADTAVAVRLPEGRVVKVSEAELAKSGGTVRLGAK